MISKTGGHHDRLQIEILLLILNVFLREGGNAPAASTIFVVFSLYPYSRIRDIKVLHDIFLFFVSIALYVWREIPIIPDSSSCDNPIFARKDGSSSVKMSINLSLSSSGSSLVSYVLIWPSFPLIFRRVFPLTMVFPSTITFIILLTIVGFVKW